MKERDRHSDAGANWTKAVCDPLDPLVRDSAAGPDLVIGSRSFTVTALSGLLMIIRVDANPSFFLEWGQHRWGRD